MRSPFSLLPPIQTHLYESRAALVEAGELLVCHWVGHLFSLTELLLILEGRTKVSSLLGNPPALPQTETSVAHSAAASGLLLVAPQHLLPPTSAEGAPLMFIRAHTWPDKRFHFLAPTPTMRSRWMCMWQFLGALRKELI